MGGNGKGRQGQLMYKHVDHPSVEGDVSLYAQEDVIFIYMLGKSHVSRDDMRSNSISNEEVEPVSRMGPFLHPHHFCNMYRDGGA